ncbi:MAG TPA: hypothetical protein IAB17_00530, partial [Candidatus Alectryocaccobium stercorigallinarum]|nr:hypothetical protein [Candidatus Alectryocaccobium stercorigallinarum]
FILAYFLSKQGMLINDSMLQILMTAAIWTGCSALLARLGKLISDRFIGNGISLILLLNIVCSLPSELIRVFSEFAENKTDAESIVNIAVIAVTAVVLFMISYLLYTAEKRIPVRYSRKLSSDERARRFDYIPLKLCPGSVMPVICAGMIYMLISTVISAVCGPDSEYMKFFDSSAWLDINTPVYSAGLAAYLILIIAFTFVYNRISSNLAETAKRLERAGCVIENIRPGMDTYMYLKRETKKMLFKGALIICAIATLPTVLSNVFGISGLSFIGTTSIIICGIIIETYKKLFAGALAGAQKSRLDKGGLL